MTLIWRDIWQDLRTIPGLHARLIHDEYVLDGPPEAIEAALTKLMVWQHQVASAPESATPPVGP